MKLFSGANKSAFWALADQGVVSLGNFATNLLLARQLPPSEYGTFVLINSASLVANGIHAAVVVSPLVVKAAPAKLERQREYVSGALTITAVLSVVAASIVMAGAVYLGRPVTGLLACLAVIAWQLQETTRRTLIAQRRYGSAIWADFVSYPGQAIVLIAVATIGHLSLEATFVALAMTSCTALIVQLMQIKASRVSSADIKANLREFWAVGKWLLAGAALSAIATQAFPWALALRGRELAAAYQAIFNVIGMTHPVLLGIHALVVPGIAARQDATPQDVLRFANRCILRFELLLAPYFLLLMIFPTTVLRAFYSAESPYIEMALPLRIVVVGYAVSVPMMVWASALTATNNVKKSLNAQALGTVTALVVGIPAAAAAGVLGAVVGDSVTRLAKALAFRAYLGAPCLGTTEGQYV